jgi:hypothetical protein
VPPFSCGGRQERQGEHWHGGVPVPGVLAADLVMVQAVSFLAAWKHSSIAHLAPGTTTSPDSGVPLSDPARVGGMNQPARRPAGGR